MKMTKNMRGIKLLNIAIVDDETESLDILKEYLDRFQTEENTKFEIKTFSNAVDFVSSYKCDFDIVFMDIEMPGYDGLSAAKEIREKDNHIGIIFVTNMGQLAIRGYEVNAIDFIVKPIGYYNFSLKLKKAFSHIIPQGNDDMILDLSNGKTRVRISDIEYIEVDKHYLIFHINGYEYRVRGTIREIEDRLSDYGFLRCNNCFLVNYRFVTGYLDNTVYVNGCELPISRPRRKDFLTELTRYFGGG